MYVYQAILTACGSTRTALQNFIWSNKMEFFKNWKEGIIIALLACVFNSWSPPLSYCTQSIVDKINTGCYYTDNTLCLNIGCYDYPNVIQVGPPRSSLLNTKVLPQYIILQYYTGWLRYHTLNISATHNIICILQKIPHL